MIKAMLIASLINALALVGYLYLLPLENYQRVIILGLTSLLGLFMFIAISHMAQEAYLDEVKKIAEQMEQEK